MDNNQKRFSVSSNIVTMFDDQSVQLRIGGLDSSMSMAFWLPTRTPEGKNTYPQEGRYSFVLTPDRVAALDMILRNDVLPAFTEGKAISRSIFTSRACTNMVQIDISEQGDVNLIYHRDISMERIPKESFVFHFDKCMTLKSYNCKTGEYEIDYVMATFYLFCQTVHSFVLNGTGVSGHGYRAVNQYSIDRIFRYLEGIATSLNVAIPSSNFGKTQNYSGNSNTWNQQMNENAVPAMQEVSNLNDMLS